MIVEAVLKQYDDSILKLLDDISKINTGNIDRDLHETRRLVKAFCDDRLAFSKAYYTIKQYKVIY